MQKSNTGSASREEAKWAVWYQPGLEEDGQIYAKALRKCKDINHDLNADMLESKQHQKKQPVVSRIAISPFKRSTHQREAYTASWVTTLVEEERAKIETEQSAKPEWRQKVTGAAYEIARTATALKPIIDIFIPQSPEYSVPYACLWIVFKGFVSRKDKNDSVLGIIISLSEDIHVFEAHANMFPTDEMKITLAELYIHTADLLWRLARYYSHGIFVQLTDALLPRAKYNFDLYRQNIAKTAERLKMLCDTGHAAEQKYIKDRIDDVDSGLRQLASKLEDFRQFKAQHLVHDLIDIWDDEVGDVEDELYMWEALQFSTPRRDHWSQNGIMACLLDWRKRSDEKHNSILWICSESNGRQSWMTEFSIDLLRVCRAQGQATTFGFCDRPRGIRWTPKQLLKQLIAQLLNQNPSMVMSEPSIFNQRMFRKATTFQSTFRLLQSIIGIMGPIILVIDRLDLCIPDTDSAEQQSIVQALAALVRAYPKTLKVLVSSGHIIGPQSLPGLPISFAKVNTRRRPRRIYYDGPPKLPAQRRPPPSLSPEYLQRLRIRQRGGRRKHEGDGDDGDEYDTDDSTVNSETASSASSYESDESDRSVASSVVSFKYIP
ncbi:hypothetical protein B0T17DRAFT_89961 [Bombardia bombarda]|uniref:Uncharacterized protein n=1 Tax=Bombardia bombarda TaxID=252184 RepID=A0AA39XMI7_9PEZI|nr:hypothetical protein B0T17DRAFT_89961 [Bombardia bombarda]